MMMTPANANAICLMPPPRNTNASPPAAITPRQRVTLMRCPANPSSAGSRVSDAARTVSTVAEAPTARPWMNLRPITHMPSTLITTVMPAKKTARPAVSMASTVASSSGKPRFSPSRYLVMMNNA